jgi:recombination protein RecA
MARGAEPASVSEILKDLSKRYGPIGSMSDVVTDVSGITTSSIGIDHLTGVGGLPIGRIIELYGQPSAGKTTCALQAAATLQQRIIAEGLDEHILYMDFERALDLDYAGALGIDTAHPSFLVAQPAWLEDGAEIFDRLVGTGKVRMTIFDSVAEMAPKDLEFGVRTAAMERARLMNSLLQRVNAISHETGACAVFLNHLVETIGMNRPGLPPQETSPGGKGLKFYASLRLAFKIIKQIKGKAPDALTGEITEQVIATHVKVKCTKNKVGIPLREAEVRVRLGAGFDNVWSALQVLSAHGRVRRGSAGWYRFDEGLGDPAMTVVSGLPSIQGEAAVLAFADEHPEWRQLLVTTAEDTIARFGGTEQLVTEPDTDEDLFAGLEVDPV